MTYIAKPKFQHPGLPKNDLGFTHRDYEGKVSTLCAGCGHDSITASIIEACYELSIEPHRVAKISGIGCSSKTPDYFLGNSHGFNSVHGRMPSVLTGANLANRDLIYLGVSGDGNSASIGFGQFAHSIRRGVNMTYIVENNGVYGLTKGQFSATADRGSKSKKGVMNTDNAIDLVAIALQLGATFVARSFSGDKTQLVPLIAAAIRHKGASFIDVVSPCVAFNNHSGSTKSFDYVREHNDAVNRLDVITGREPITVDYAPGTVQMVEQHDGSRLALRKLDADYDPHDRLGAMTFLQKHAAKGQIVTGLLYVDPEAEDMHSHLDTVETPLNTLDEEALCPGSAALDKINASLRCRNSGRLLSQQPLPLPVEPLQSVGKRHRRKAAAGLDDEIIPSQPRQGVVDIEIGGDADHAHQKLLDSRIKHLACDRPRFGQQAVIGQQHFFPVLVLRLTDQVGEDAGIIVDVAVVDVVGEFFLMDQRLAVEISPLPQQEGAQRQQSGERGQRLLQVPVVDRAGKTEVEAGDQKQHRHGRCQLDQDRHAAENGRHAQRKMVEQAPHHTYIGKQRLEIGARNVAEILEQHRAAADLLSAAPCARQCPAFVGRVHVARLGRDHQDNVIVDHDLERPPAQTEPGRNLDRLHVVPAAEHADIAIILDRRLDLHPYPGALAKGFRDLLMRDLDEVGVGQHADEFVAQLAVGRAQILGRAELVRIDLGIEVEIGLAQPIELFEIFVVQDGAEHAGELPESRLVGFVKTALCNEPVDDIRLPQRNDTVTRLPRGELAPGFGKRVHHELPASVMGALFLQTKSGT